MSLQWLYSYASERVAIGPASSHILTLGSASIMAPYTDIGEKVLIRRYTTIGNVTGCTIQIYI